MLLRFEKAQNSSIGQRPKCAPHADRRYFSFGAKYMDLYPSDIPLTFAQPLPTIYKTYFSETENFTAKCSNVKDSIKKTTPTQYMPDVKLQTENIFLGYTSSEPDVLGLHLLLLVWLHSMS